MFSRTSAARRTSGSRLSSGSVSELPLSHSVSTVVFSSDMDVPYRTASPQLSSRLPRERDGLHGRGFPRPKVVDRPPQKVEGPHQAQARGASAATARLFDARHTARLPLYEAHCCCITRARYPLCRLHVHRGATSSTSTPTSDRRARRLA